MPVTFKYDRDLLIVCQSHDDADSKTIADWEGNLRPRGFALLDMDLACFCLIFARRALNPAVSCDAFTSSAKHDVEKDAYSSAASLSSLLQCSRASFTATLACIRARSAFLSAASALIMRSRAAVIDVSSVFRWRRLCDFVFVVVSAGSACDE